jgi:hypothetical protein
VVNGAEKRNECEMKREEEPEAERKRNVETSMDGVVAQGRSGEKRFADRRSASDDGGP